MIIWQAKSGRGQICSGNEGRAWQFYTKIHNILSYTLICGNLVVPYDIPENVNETVFGTLMFKFCSYFKELHEMFLDMAMLVESQVS